MDRRSLLKGAVAVPLVTALPIPTLAVARDIHIELQSTAVSTLWKLIQNRPDFHAPDLLRNDDSEIWMGVGQALFEKADSMGYACTLIPEIKEKMVCMKESYYLYWLREPGLHQGPIHRANLKVMPNSIKWQSVKRTETTTELFYAFKQSV